MQFSIFGVPFKCAKDMFTWEKIKWSIYVYWAQLWRGGFLSIGVLALVVAVLFLPAFTNSAISQVFNGSNFEQKARVYLLYSMHVWVKDSLISGIGLLVCWVVGLILAASFIQYYATFRKNYKSFDRHFFKPQVEKFWSWGFWKPFILITLLGLLIGLIVGALFGAMDIPQGVVTLINLIVGVVLFHVFLHGGSWGFILTPKQITLLTEGKE